MLIITALNVSGGDGTHEDGTADYEVCAGVNERCFWKGTVSGHIRKAGAAVLLRKIADRMENNVTT